ncbi:hypothetical protein OG218_03670 [Kineococcus sp. NBC_00420]
MPDAVTDTAVLHTSRTVVQHIATLLLTHHPVPPAPNPRRSCLHVGPHTAHVQCPPPQNPAPVVEAAARPPAPPAPVDDALRHPHRHDEHPVVVELGVFDDGLLQPEQLNPCPDPRRPFSRGDGSDLDNQDRSHQDGVRPASQQVSGASTALGSAHT